MTRLLIVSIALALACSAVTSAQTTAAPPVRLTLEEAIGRGLEASHRLAELRAREAGARAALASSEAAERPIVSGQAGYMRTNHVDEFVVLMPGAGARSLYPDVPDNYRTRLDVQWPIYTGGRTGALQRAAEAEIAATRADADAARADLRLEITRAYWALLTAEEAARVLDQALARAAAHLADVRHAFAVGLVPPNDVAAVEAQESRQRMLLMQARGQRDVSAAALARLLALPPETVILLDAQLERPAGVQGESSALVADARRQRAERIAIERRAEAADARRDAAAAGLRPIVGLAGGYDVARPNPRIFPRQDAWKGSWDAGVALTWSFWDGGRSGAAAAEAAAAATALRERLADLDTVIGLEVRQRTIELGSAAAAVRAAADAVRAAGEARRVVQDRYTAGIATNTEVLDAQVALLQAELDRTRALADVRLAEARLERALGR